MEPLVQALNNSQNEEACNFLYSLLKEKPLEYLSGTCQLILNERLELPGIRQAVVTVGTLFRITFVKAFDDVSAMYHEFPSEVRDSLKQALFKCLMYNDDVLVRSSAYILAIMAKIEVEAKEWIDLFDVLAEFFQRAKNGEYSTFGPAVLFRNVFENVTFKIGRHFNEKRAWQMLGPPVCEILAVPDATNPEAVLSKIEAARVIKSVLKKHKTVLIQQRASILQTLLANARFDDVTLNRAIVSAIRSFVVVFYDDIGQNPAVVSSLIELTQWGFATEKAEIQTNVISIWEKFAKHEARIRDKSSGITQAVAPGLIPNLVLLLQYENVDEAPSTWGSGRSAYFCLKAFGSVAPEVVFSKCTELLVSAKNESPQECMSSALLFQVLASMRTDAVIPILQNGFVFLQKLFASEFTPLTMASLVVVKDLLEFQPGVWNEEMVNSVLVMVRTALDKGNVDVIKIGTLVVNSLAKFLAKNVHAKLVAEYLNFVNILFMVPESPKVRNEDRIAVLADCYAALRTLIGSMPDASFGDPVFELIAARLQEDLAPGEVSLTKRELLCGLCGALPKASHERIRGHVGTIVEWLLKYLYEMNMRSGEVLRALAQFFYFYPDELNAYLTPGMGIAMKLLENQGLEENTARMSLQLVGDIFAGRHRMLIDQIPPIMKLVSTQMLNFQNENIWYTAYAVYALSQVIFLSDGEREAELAAEIGRRLMDLREPLMKIFRCATLMLKSPHSDERYEMSQLFQHLLMGYTAVAIIYDWEGAYDNGMKVNRGDFLDAHSKEFVDVVVRGGRAGLYNINIAHQFLRFMDNVMRIFGRANHFNIQLHGREFNQMFDKVLNPSWTPDETARSWGQSVYSYWNSRF